MQIIHAVPTAWTVALQLPSAYRQYRCDRIMFGQRVEEAGSAGKITGSEGCACLGECRNARLIRGVNRVLPAARLEQLDRLGPTTRTRSILRKASELSHSIRVRPLARMRVPYALFALSRRAARFTASPITE